jgi:Ribonuclease T2 family
MCTGIEPDDCFYIVESIKLAIKESIGFTPGLECNRDESGNQQLSEVYLCVDCRHLWSRVHRMPHFSENLMQKASSIPFILSCTQICFKLYLHNIFFFFLRDICFSFPFITRLGRQGK